MSGNRRAGRVLIWLGVMAWVVYAVVKYLLRMDVSVTPFLVAHLLGVVPGAVLRWLPPTDSRTSAKQKNK